MPVTLCLDFGNTRKKIAIFEGADLVRTQVINDDAPETINSLLTRFKPAKSILSSVIDHRPELETELAASTRFHKLSYQTRLDFTTPVGKPATIGADRLALAAAAVRFYAGKNVLVVGLGTCVTYNFINKYKELVGGGISAGLEMRLRAMHDYTAKLPLIRPAADAPLIGYDTETNMLSGTILGLAMEIDGFVDEYRRKFGNFNVVLTGGDLVHLASHLKNRIFADPDLIFKGLYAISEVNNP